MLVDHERVLLRLKEEMADRQGIGRDALYALISKLEVECAVEEGVPERAFRAYGVLLSRDLITSGDQPAPEEAHAPLADGEGPALPRADGSKEDSHAGDRNRDLAAV